LTFGDSERHRSDQKYTSQKYYIFTTIKFACPQNNNIINTDLIKNIHGFVTIKARSFCENLQQTVLPCLQTKTKKLLKMFSSKVAIFLCASLALTMAAPTGGLLGSLDLGNILKPITGAVGDLVGNLTDDLSELLKDVTGLVAALLKELIKVINQLVKVLNIPSGTDPLAFVQNLVSQLEPIVNELLGTVSSGVGEIVDDVSQRFL
jgi:hypothetical protein